MSVYRPPTTHTRRTAAGDGSWPATSPGVRRMPIPSVLPTMTARPKPRPSTRRRPPGAAGLWLEGNKDDVNGTANVSRRVARSASLELDIAGLPAVDDRLAVGGVL